MNDVFRWFDVDIVMMGSRLRLGEVTYFSDQHQKHKVLCLTNNGTGLLWEILLSTFLLPFLS